MKAYCAVLSTVLLACGSSSVPDAGTPTSEAPPNGTATSEPQVKVLPVEPALAKVTVAMASATLADDCP